VAFAVWALGCAAVLAVVTLAHLRLRAMVQDSERILDRDDQQLAEECAERLHLQIPFVLLRSPSIGIPLTYGLLRPRVLLPATAADWPAERRRSVLLHELAHVQRHDCLTQALGQLACAVFWFHPGAWWAATRQRVERERACDDRVLAADTRASAYADHLLDVVRSVQASAVPALGAVAFARPSQFEGRLIAVLDPRRDRRGVSARLAAPVATAALVLAAPLAMLQPASAHRVADAREAQVEGRASEVTPPPPPAITFDQKMSWARESASRQGDCWIGYQLASRGHSRGGVMGDTGGFDLTTLDGEYKGPTLADVLEGRLESSWAAHRGNDAGPVAFLFHVPGGGGKRFDRMRMQSVTLPAALGSRRLHWLGEVQDDVSLPWIMQMADHETDQDIRAELIHAAGMHDDAARVVPWLSGILAGHDPDRVRSSAAEALAEHPGPETLDRLKTAAHQDRSEQVRRDAVEAIGRLRTPEALDELLALAHGSDEPTRREAFDELGQRLGGDEDAPAAPPSPANPMKEPKAPEVPTPPQVEAPAQPADAPTAETKAMEKLRKHEEKLERAAKLGAEIDGEAPPADAGDTEVQRSAVEALGNYPEAQSLTRLRRIAEHHPDLEVRKQAVESIGRLGTEAAFAILNQIAWQDKNEEMRSMATETIGHQYPAEQSFPKLQELARKHPSSDTRRMAVESVGRVEDPQVLPLLDDLARTSPDQEVRRQAVESIGRRDEPDVMKRLAAILESSPDPEVRRQAVESMSRHDPDAALPILEKILRTGGRKKGS
jgi:beta-lactamase regulating signal transducer with metallopeptidase domain/HEAT repeat protein